MTPFEKNQTPKNHQSTHFEGDKGGRYIEYDQWGRVTFHQESPRGYWCLKYYSPAEHKHQAKPEPIDVIHKWWPVYNGLKLF